MSDGRERVETIDMTYGRLLESVHISGYSMERACTGLELLIEDNRWQRVGKGFEQIDAFLNSFDLSQFKISVDKRKKLAARLAELEATQRATAHALGVSDETIRRDIGKTTNVAKPEKPTLEKTPETTNVAPPPDTISEKENRLDTDPAKVIKKSEEKAHVANNSGDNEWYTPHRYISIARAVMGSIDTDPASSDVANTIVKAKHYYTADNSGLKPEAKWQGNVWMNPPYSAKLIPLFIKKLVAEYKIGKVIQACVLVNNATETAWGKEILAACTAVCFITGRVKFIDEQLKESGAPLQGQMLLYLGENTATFVEQCSDMGEVFIHG